MSMLSNRRQFSGKLEAEEGTVEALALADAKTIAYDPKFQSNPEKHESDPARFGGAAQPQLIGKVPADVSVQIRMRGSGAAATDPDWIKYLKPCGFSSSLLSSIAIGAITGGPFVHGETITGGTSAATGKVIFKTVTGATSIYFVVLTSTFQSGEVITGGTSAATVTTSGAPASAGRVYEPTLSNVPSISLGFNQDSYFEKLKGGRGNAKFSVAAGGPGLIDLSYQGVDAGQEPESLFEGVVYEETLPPVFKSGAILLDSYEPKISSIDFDLGNKLSQRDDPQDTQGILSYLLTSRLITGTLVVEKVAAATFDYRGKWLAGTEMITDFTLGTTTGHKFRFYFPRAQITNIQNTDKDGLAQFSVEFQANGGLEKNDDLVIVQL